MFWAAVADLWAPATSRGAASEPKVCLPGRANLAYREGWKQEDWDRLVHRTDREEKARRCSGTSHYTCDSCSDRGRPTCARQRKVQGACGSKQAHEEHRGAAGEASRTAAPVAGEDGRALRLLGFVVNLMTNYNNCHQKFVTFILHV